MCHKRKIPKDFFIIRICMLIAQIIIQMLGTLFKLKGANVTKKNITKDLGASKKLRRTGYYGIYNEGLQNVM